MKTLSYLFSGLLFGVGLIVGGMTQPGKVVGFLDFFGNWDPSLAFVMIGAIAVHTVGYRLMRKRSHPLWALRFQVPTRRDLDSKLILGAGLFGVGWGMAGYCPGPALTSLATLGADALVFVASMALGMIVYGMVERAAQKKTVPSDLSPTEKPQASEPQAREAT